MNRYLWLQSLTKFYCPAWQCPICHKGTLALVKDTVRFKETVRSKRAHGHEDWDPQFSEYTFTAWAKCRHPACEQEFAIAGRGGLQYEIVANNSYEMVEYFRPLICEPMPDMINFPAKCPPEVKNELQAAFALFWSQQAACAGRIRVALEGLMNYLHVPKKKKGKTGKYHDLTLHARIDAFAKSQPTIGPQLMALKWLGNTGSHNAEVSKKDLLDAFEIMEYALDEIINKRSEKVAKLAKTLTKKHGR